MSYTAPAVQSLTAEASTDLCGFRFFRQRRDPRIIAEAVPVSLRAWGDMPALAYGGSRRSWLAQQSARIETLKATVCKEVQCQFVIMGITLTTMLAFLILEAVGAVIQWLVTKWLDRHYGLTLALAAI